MARTIRGGTRRPVKRKYRKSRRQKGGAETLTLPKFVNPFKGGRQMGGATLTLPRFVNPFPQAGGATLTLPRFVNPFPQAGGATLTLPMFVNPLSKGGRQTGAATVSLSGGASVVRKGGRRQMGGLSISDPAMTLSNLQARVDRVLNDISSLQALIAAGNNTPEINSDLLTAQNELKTATSQLEELRQLQQTTTGSAGLTGPAGPTMPPTFFKGDVSSFSSIGSSYNSTTLDTFRLNRLVGPYNVFAMWMVEGVNKWGMIITKLTSVEKMLTETNESYLLLNNTINDLTSQGNPPLNRVPISINHISNLPSDKLPGKFENSSLYTISGFKFMNLSNYWVRVVDKDSNGKMDTSFSLAQMDSLVASNVSGEAATTTAGPAGPTTTRGNCGTAAAAAATAAAEAANKAADAANKAAVSATAAAAAAAAAAALD